MLIVRVSFLEIVDTDVADCFSAEKFIFVQCIRLGQGALLENFLNENKKQ